ncbi:hypothetical protein AMATHDRAFT_86018 [Amanita thiersii Skay4041]|uniref:OTU domain-containing protein n=1 Tax=Amanita thiersii Skay4041 TaxID=703135 RepID=A0A2A9NLB4_9AGAR|nr:hypothetical protein AMATHDRAFT_86018 [Amanita thiersii Skay4041]
MVSAKKQSNRAKHPSQFRSRQTRSSKGRTLLSDPVESTQALTEQLRALGLYAVSTLGDGNCLFRALSDQYYGTHSKHHQVRRDICDWIATHKPRYAPFVDDERGIDVHIQCMRENATYGGHMELSAFAHLTRRNIKVIQPGLVYVIEWNSGGDPAEDVPPQQPPLPDDPLSHSRDRRKLRRERKKEKQQQHSASTQSHDESDDADEDAVRHSTMYVAYHDWEHFSSIRNLKGPHTGLPIVEEAPAPSSPDHLLLPLSKHQQKKAVTRVKLKLGPPSTASSTPTSSSSPASTSTKPTSLSPSASSSLSKLCSSQDTDPTAIPLPSSRTPSPTPSLSNLSSLTPSPAPYPPTYDQMDVEVLSRTARSPKRNLDDGGEEGEEYASEAGTKRARTGFVTGSMEGKAGGKVEARVTRSMSRKSLDQSLETMQMHVDTDNAEEEESGGKDEEDEDGRGEPDVVVRAPDSSASLMASDASDSSAPSSSSSASSSASPSPPPPSFHKQARVPKRLQQQLRERNRERPLTKRQRKALGLPKDRETKESSGVLVIPSRKSTRSGAASPAEAVVGVVTRSASSRRGNDDTDGTEEWRRNGNGRVDVRGFRELKI